MTTTILWSLTVNSSNSRWPQDEGQCVDSIIEDGSIIGSMATDWTKYCVIIITLRRRDIYWRYYSNIIDYLLILCRIRANADNIVGPNDWYSVLTYYWRWPEGNAFSIVLLAVIQW